MRANILAAGIILLGALQLPRFQCCRKYERAALDARGHSVYHKEKDHETTYQP
jgi:hypothetical protein